MRTSFELILDDTSPVISYYPFAETPGAPNLVAGWNSYFSESGFLLELGQTGNGTSMHVTSLDGAELTIQWFGLGTGISLFGSIFQAAYSITIDGEVQYIGLPQGDLLAEVQGLEAGEHLIALVAHPSPGTASNPSSYIAFDRAALNVSMPVTGATVSTEFVNTQDSRWAFSGNWTQLSDPVLDSAPSQNYCLSITHGNTASISFKGSAITVTGIRNTAAGHYNVTLDGKTTTFNGHSNWLEPSTLFLQAGLDEMSKHTLTVMNVDDASLAIAGLNITHLSGGTLSSDHSSPGLSTGTIIALALAGLAALIAISSLFIYIYVRRQQMRDRNFIITIAPGLTSGVPLEDLTSSSQKRRQSKHAEHVSPISVHRIERDRRGLSTADDGSVVVMVPSKRTTLVDPASPLPYLRQQTSSHGQKESTSLGRPIHDMEFDEHGPEGQARLGRLHRNSLDGNKKNSMSNKRSLSVDPGPSRLLDLDIPSPQLNIDTTNPSSTTPTTSATSSTPAKVAGSVQFAASVRGEERRTPLHGSFAVGMFGQISDMSSISTMQFGHPPRSSDHSASVSAEPPTPPPKDEIAGVSMGDLRVHNALRNPAVPLPGASKWQPPW